MVRKNFKTMKGITYYLIIIKNNKIRTIEQYFFAKGAKKYKLDYKRESVMHRKTVQRKSYADKENNNIAFMEKQPRKKEKNAHIKMFTIEEVVE